MASTQSVVKAILDRALSNNDFSESAASLSDETLGELVMAGFDYDAYEKTLKLVDSCAAFTLYQSLLEAESKQQVAAADTRLTKKKSKKTKKTRVLELAADDVEAAKRAAIEVKAMNIKEANVAERVDALTVAVENGVSTADMLPPPGSRGGLAVAWRKAFLKHRIRRYPGSSKAPGEHYVMRVDACAVIIFRSAPHRRDVT